MSVKENCTLCFKALSIPSRMRIYGFLGKNGPCSVSEIVEMAELKQPTVSYHLKEMEQSGLLKSKKSGKEVLYSISGICPTDHDKCVLK